MRQSSNDHEGLQLEFPRPGGLGSFYFNCLLLVIAFYASSYAVMYLVAYESWPVYAVVCAALWLMCMIMIIWGLVSEVMAYGVKNYLLGILCLFSKKHWIDIVEVGSSDPLVYVYFRLLRMRFKVKSFRCSEIEYIDYSAGQCTGMTGRDYNDWCVLIRFHYDETTSTHYSDRGIRIGPSWKMVKAKALCIEIMELFGQVGVHFGETEKYYQWGYRYKRV